MGEDLQPDTPKRSKVSSLHWLMISLVFTATAINYLDRQTLSVVAPIMMDQFHMTNEGYSRVIMAFMLAYTIMNAVSGPLIDRMGTRIGFALTTIGLVSLAMLGYTGTMANMLALPADVFPKNVVASIWGLASMGAGFEGMVFAFATGWLVDHYSYRPVFIGFGLIPIIALLIIWFVLGPFQPVLMKIKAGAVDTA